MKAIVGKDKYTGKPAPYATHADAVQVGSGNDRRKLSDVLEDLSGEATSEDIAAMFEAQGTESGGGSSGGSSGTSSVEYASEGDIADLFD